MAVLVEFDVQVSSKDEEVNDDFVQCGGSDCKKMCLLGPLSWF